MLEYTATYLPATCAVVNTIFVTQIFLSTCATVPTIFHGFGLLRIRFPRRVHQRFYGFFIDGDYYGI